MLPELLVTLTPRGLWTRIAASLPEKCFSNQQIELFSAALCLPGAPTATINWYRVFSKYRLDYRKLAKHPSWHQKIPVPVQVVWGCNDAHLIEANVDNLEEFVCVCFF